MKFLLILLFFIELYAESNSLDNNLTNINELSFKCDVGQSDACLDLAEIYRNGINGYIDYNKVSFFYAKACDLQDKYGCYNVGISYLYGCGIDRYVDYEQALSFFKKACKLGNKNNDACKIMKTLTQKIEKENFYPNLKNEVNCSSLPVEIGGLE